MGTKVRWSIQNKGFEESEIETEEQQLMDKKIHNEATLLRNILDFESNTIDMGRKRCTNIKGNRSVYMPRGGNSRREAIYATREQIWHKVLSDYLTQHCNAEGEQTQFNLTPEQEIGLSTLHKRISRGEILVLQADKGKKFIIVTPLQYQHMAELYIEGDEVIDRNEAEHAQCELTTHCRAVAEIFSLGKNLGPINTARSVANVSSWAVDVLKLKLLPKVHKTLEQNGDLKSRPLVAAASGITSRASNLVADIIDSVVRSDPDRLEDISTEEVLAQLSEAKNEVWESGVRKDEVVTASIDAVALYPNLDQVVSSQLVGQAIMNSKV